MKSINRKRTKLRHRKEALERILKLPKEQQEKRAVEIQMLRELTNQVAV